MSGTRLTRKVTVEGGKKLPEGGGQSSSSSSGTRRSVFDRLGPGTTERPRVRESFPPEKCRNWLRDGRCQFGRNCKFLHGPFSEPKQRTKSIRSIVRSDVERSEERDESGMGVRTRSLDSIGDDNEEEREIPVKKKKHRPEESLSTGKKSEKAQRRQQEEKGSSEGDQESVEENRKRKKKLKKRSLSGGVVITKPRSPEQEEMDWEDEEYGERRSDMEWEERGELDYERQLNLEKRRQDLQRQLALMDEEEEAAREKSDRKIKEVKKDKGEEQKLFIPVVHSKLHPEKSSVSPGDELSSVSSQSTPKKKKKKTEGELKKAKTKRKLSPSEKELKKRKSAKPVAEGAETDIIDERRRKIPSELSPEAPKLPLARTQRQIEISEEEKPRGVKKKQSKIKTKDASGARSGTEAHTIPSDATVRRPQRSPPEKIIPRDKRSYSPEEQKAPVDKGRRRVALSSPEGSDSPALQYPREERSRGVTDSSDGSPRKSVGDIHVTVPHVEADYKLAGKGYDRRSRGQESPVISDRERELRPKTGKDVRRVEEERTPRRKVLASDQPPRSPSPAEIPLTGPITPPTEQRRQRSPPRGDRRGPQTPPGEPEFDNDGPKHVSNERAPPRRRGPYTPPHPTTPPVRGRTEKNREEFYEGRSKPVSHRDGMPRAKERDERDRYPKPRDEERGDEAPRGGRGHPIMDEELSRTRVRDEEPGRGRNRDDRQEDYHQRGRAKDDRADEFPRVRDREPERGEDHHRVGHEDTRSDEFSRRKPEGEDEFLRRRDERDDELSRVRNRDLEREDERQRRKDEHQRGRARDEPEEDFQRSRGRDVPRRQVEGGDERYWEAPRGERDFRDGQFAGRDKRRPDIPRQEFPDISRGRERPGERPRDRDGRHPPPGPEYHRRGPSPTPHGPPRRSPPPHGPPRGPHRFMERRRSLSPGGRRDEGYRQGPPREGGYGMGREPIPGRGGYPAPFDERGRPLDSRRRNSPPPRQCAERGRGAPRMRGGRGDRGFPERVRPPGDRYQEPPRDRGGPWESEGRREREHPRDRNRPPHESRDRERKPRGELSPGRGPKQWEERKGGSPGRAVSPPHERRVHEQEKIPRDIEEERRRRSADEDEWEYEEDIGQDKGKAPRPHGERKRPRETASAVSTPESYVGGKRRRSETPETEEVVVHEVLEGQEKGDRHDPSVDTGIPESAGTPSKQLTKLKKKKTGKKEGKVMKSEGEGSLEGQGPQGSGLEKEASTEGEKLLKAEKKHKKEKGKTKEKGTKKKKKNSAALVEAKHEVAKEVTEELTNLPEDESHPSENLGEGTQSSESEPTVKVAKKLRHIDIPEGEEVKGREIVEKPPKKKKKKKHQPELVFQPWADLEGEDEDTKSSKSETKENQEHSKDNQSVSSKNNDQLKLADEKLDSSKADAPVEVFSDWSDDSSIGDDAWSDGNDAREMAEEKPKVDEKEPENVSTPVQNSVPAYDDVYDPISDDELDAMLGEEDDEGRVSKGNSAGPTNTPMPVEDVDWSALVSSQASSEKTGEEPGSHLKRFSPGHVFSRIGISSALAGPRLTKLVQQACAETANDSLSGVETVESNDGDGTSSSHVSFGALMAGAAAKRREREMLFTNVGPCRRALCARKDLGMRKRLRRLTGKIGLFQTPPTAPIDNELYLMSVDLYKHENSSADSSVAKLIPSRVGSVLSTVTS